MYARFPRTTALLAMLVLWAGAGCRTPSQRLAGVGGVTGAIAGAAIGGRRGKGVAGAAIGGTLGALSGAAIGDAIEESQATPATYAQTPSGHVTLPEILQMTQAGLGESVITNHVQTRGLARPLQVEDLIALRQAGASESLILNLQNASAQPLAAASPPPVVVSQPPVVIHEPPPVIVPVGPRCRPRRRPGFHWGVTFSN